MIAKVSINRENALEMPLIALRGVVVFPDTLNHFDVSRPRSVRALERCLESGEPVFLVAQRDISVEEPVQDDLYRYGVVCEVRQVLRLHDGLMKVLVDCKYRARLLTMREENGMYVGEIIRQSAARIRPADASAAEALVRSIREQLNLFAEYYPKLTDEILITANSPMPAQQLAEYLAFNLPLEFEDKQAILEQNSSFKRLDMLHNILARENSVLGLEKEIQAKVQESLAQNQREYYLREQMRTISQELGEDADLFADIDGYREKIRALPLEDTYKKKLLKEADRLQQNPPNSQEYGVIDQYLSTVTSLPWQSYSQDNFDIRRAQKILDRDHYGLKEVKERILEYLAVRARTDNMSGQIICLVGPPGVGKTSIARSLAECMGKKFARMSLGGVRDEAEIRGHRRTYVAAMPGRIIAAIQNSGTANPLILMDEIDKLASDYKGDPSSALLEALDPEQNGSFVDHYIDVPFDLSQVTFVTTANDRGAIPSALIDRMDVLELSSYTRTEKYHIAKEHLLPKQLEKHGLSKKDVSLTEKALYTLIDDYTAEAGVRNLERQIAKLLRKCARKLIEGEQTPIKVNEALVRQLLGVPMRRDSIAAKKDSVGVVNGLAWTAAGGELLPIEAVVIKGSGKLEITGSLGDVMKESARLAITYGRTLGGTLAFPEKLLSEYDIHIHAPEGAVPKDGPSAGVTMATALVSAVCGIPVRRDVAMTGEITLQGRVLPIGGLKEKLIAAHKEKMHTVLIPAANVCDLQLVPQEVREALEIIPVEHVSQVLRHALISGPEKPRNKTGAAASGRASRSAGEASA